MTVTINSMELIYADLLTPDQLMEEDLIKVDGEIVTVVGIESNPTGDIYYVAYEDDFGDKDITEFTFDEKVELYVFREDSED
jgi:predicted secreted protein